MDKMTVCILLVEDEDAHAELVRRAFDKLPVIIGDKLRITQVFQNLIGNAVKFMDKSEGGHSS